MATIQEVTAFVRDLDRFPTHSSLAILLDEGRTIVKLVADFIDLVTWTPLSAPIQEIVNTPHSAVIIVTLPAINPGTGSPSRWEQSMLDGVREAWTVIAAEQGHAIDVLDIVISGPSWMRSLSIVCDHPSVWANDFDDAREHSDDSDSGYDDAA